MVDEFYVILNNAMKLEDGSNFVLNEEDFYKDSIMVRDFLKSIYDGYPDINKEQVKNMMENIINAGYQLDEETFSKLASVIPNENDVVKAFELAPDGIIT